MISGTVTAVPSGTLCCDTDTPITAAIATALANAGISGVFRYISRALPEPGDLTTAEAEIILAAGLGLMVVQHAPSANWSPTVASGTAWGMAAAANLAAIGMPPGIFVAKDHEGVAGAASTTMVGAHINAWAKPITAGYQAGLYVGYDAGYGSAVTSAPLFDDLTLSRYWKSASNVPAPFKRGFCIQQMLGGPSVGIAIDLDVVTADHLGGLPNWIIRS